MVFARNGGGHVALYEGEEGNDYLIRGGNQSDAVSLMRMPKSKFSRSHMAGDSCDHDTGFRGRQGQIVKSLRPTKIGVGAAVVAAVAATAHWIGAHPALALVAALVASAARPMRHPDNMEIQMNLLGFLMLLAIIAAAYWRVVLPRLRKFAWWKRFRRPRLGCCRQLENHRSSLMPWS